jgi:hypothetical protein
MRDLIVKQLEETDIVRFGPNSMYQHKDGVKP